MQKSSKSTNQKNEDIAEQAAEWLIVLDDDSSEETTEQFQRWLAQNSEHQIAIDRIKALIGDIESVNEHYIDHDTSKNIIIKAVSQQQKMISNFKKSILSIAILGSTFLFTALQYAPVRYWTADQRNSSLLWQKHILDDHSQINVSGKTAYNIKYTKDHRQIELLQGNILVDVAKDKNRPFLVNTKHGTIQALGTRFIVTQDGQITTVTMLESKTAVWSINEPRHKLEIVTGQRLKLGEKGIISTQPISINAQLFEQAWQQHTLIANGDQLVDVLDHLSIYYAGKMSFDRQSLSGIQVTATLPLDNIDVALQQLANELDLTVQQAVPYFITIKKNNP